MEHVLYVLYVRHRLFRRELRSHLRPDTPGKDFPQDLPCPGHLLPEYPDQMVRSPEAPRWNR